MYNQTGTSSRDTRLRGFIVAIHRSYWMRTRKVKPESARLQHSCVAVAVSACQMSCAPLHATASLALRLAGQRAPRGKPCWPPRRYPTSPLFFPGGWLFLRGAAISPAWGMTDQRTMKSEEVRETKVNKGKTIEK